MANMLRRSCPYDCCLQGGRAADEREWRRTEAAEWRTQLAEDIDAGRQ